MAQHYECLMHSILHFSDQPIGELTLLTEHEKQQMITEWNNTDVDYPKNVSISDLFQEQIKRTPEAIALISAERQVTYQQLNNQANQLAHYLKENAVQPGSLVAVCMERDIEFIIGLLAILKLGAAYIPLDPNYPNARLNFIIEDSAAEFLLTRSKLKNKFDYFIGKIIYSDSDSAQREKYALRDLTVEHDSARLAYIIYTSGTTGKPKGVAIDQAAILARLYWCQSTYAMTEQDRFLHLFSFSFDGAVISTWWPLSFGGAIVLPSQLDLSDTHYLASQVYQHKCSIIFGTPVMLNAIFEQLDQFKCDQKICAIAGGEKLTRECLETINKVADLFYNFYGPTECTAMCTAHKINKNSFDEPSLIGKPLTNTKAYILDKNKQPVPMGVVGELYIGGVGLARNYVNQPGLTQEKFIVNPFVQDPAARLYKTGDFACYLPDGNIHYINRRDNLIKLRGYRIELDEITQVLHEHPHVKQAAVIIGGDSALTQRIIACIVGKVEISPQKMQDIRQFLAERLPDYLLPQSIITVACIPLTVQGKLDKEAVLNQVSAFTQDAGFYTSARTYTEFKLMQI